MPPKKSKEPEAVKPLLGRPSNHVKAGIVGLPNVGKSSFFNALCKMSIAAENYPFCTIDPNVSRVQVPDDRFTDLVDKFKPASIVPAYLTITDIAGLVKGAHQGEGLGNAFLSHISAVDSIIHVLRVFDDSEVIHVEDSIDPCRDLDIITEELRMKDMATFDRFIEAADKASARGQNKEKKEECERLKEMKAWFVESGKEVRSGDWKAKDIDILNEMQLLTAKPAIYVVNMSEKDFIRKKNKWLPKIKAWIDERTKEPLLPMSVALEAKLVDMADDAERAKYLEEISCKSAFDKIILSAYHSLHLIHYFTAGADEVRAWTIRKNTKAPQAAGTIHTDFERGFICADAYNYDDIKEHGTEIAVREAGKIRQQGREWIVPDGCILHFKFNVSDPKKGGKK